MARRKNMIESKAKLMKDLRSLWEIEVGPPSNDFDPDITATYRTIVEGGDGSERTILDCIRATDAWRARQVMVAETTFAFIKDREPTPEELASLEGIVTIDELKDAIERMTDAEAGDIVSVAAPTANTVEVADSGTASTSGDDAHARPVGDDLVDLKWIDEFQEIYQRDPFVHEYVHLRRRDETLPELYAKFVEVKVGIVQVYKNYLNTTMTASKLVREYVPELFENADLVEQTVQKITSSSAYAAAMKKRLAQLHECLFSPLDDDDAEYIFETRVKAERLALTEDLNYVVISYREETDAHNATMTDLWRSTLGREPCERELSKYKGRYREDPTAASAHVMRELVESMEFAGVVKARVSEVCPDMPVYEVYDVVDRVFKNHNMVKEDLDDALRAECGDAFCPQSAGVEDAGDA